MVRRSEELREDSRASARRQWRPGGGDVYDDMLGILSMHMYVYIYIYYKKEITIHINY